MKNEHDLIKSVGNMQILQKIFDGLDVKKIKDKKRIIKIKGKSFPNPNFNKWIF